MDGDTTFTKLFVGGLAWKTRRDAVQRHFEQFGEIAEAVVIVDKHTGRSKGYGFVTFRDPDGAARALEDPTPMIDGRRANCNLAAFGAARHVHPVAAPFGMTRLMPTMIATSSSYQGSAPAAMAASYFPQALHAYPYYYGYNGGYSQEIMYQAHMGYYGGYGVSGAQQHQAQLQAARPAGGHHGQQLQVAGDQTRSSPNPATQYSQMSQYDYVQQAQQKSPLCATQHKSPLCAEAIPEKPKDDTGMTTAGRVSAVGSGVSEVSSDSRPASKQFTSSEAQQFPTVHSSSNSP